MPKIPPSQPSLFGSPGEPDERFDPDPRMTLGEAMFFRNLTLFRFPTSLDLSDLDSHLEIGRAHV